MSNALEDHVGTVSIRGRTVTNVCVADYINGLAGDEQELINLVCHLDKTSASYGMEISAEKTKLLTNTINGINKKINVRGHRLETVSNFKYLGSVVTDEGSKPQIISRIAQKTATLTRLKPTWKYKNITLRSKIRLMRSFAM